MKAVADKVIVEFFECDTEKEKVSENGIVFSTSTHLKEPPQRGKVVCVGPGRITLGGILIEPEVKVGDIVVFAKHAGAEIKNGDKKYRVIRESDILGVEENEEINDGKVNE